MTKIIQKASGFKLLKANINVDIYDKLDNYLLNANQQKNNAHSESASNLTEQRKKESNRLLKLVQQKKLSTTQANLELSKFDTPKLVKETKRAFIEQAILDRLEKLQGNKEESTT